MDAPHGLQLSGKGRVLFLADQAMPGPEAGDRGVLAQPWLLHHALLAGWREADLEALPVSTTDIAERLAAMAALDEVFPRFAAHLAAALNSLHGLDLPPRSWEILLGPWLQVYLHILHDRHARLDSAARLYGAHRLVVPAPGCALAPARNYAGFIEATAHGGAGVLALYGAVALRMGLGVTPFETGAALVAAPPEAASAPAMPLPAVPGRAAPPGGRILAHTFWPPANAGALLGQGRVSLYEPGTRQPKWRSLERKGLAGFQARNEFERIAGELLPASVPPGAVEEFADAARAAEPLSGYQAYFSGNWTAEEMEFRTVAALGAARGAKILGWQHGGTYGQFLRCPTEWAERRICDGYATWGWEDRDAALPARLAPLPHLYFDALQDSWTGGRDKALWASTSVPRHTYRYQLYGQDATVLPVFFGMRTAFAAGLSAGVLADLRFRPYLYEYGWGGEDQALFRGHPEVEVVCSGSLPELLASTRLFLCDHVGTSMLQALLANTPTILFWDREQTPERETAAPFFDALRAAGVLFHDPDQAARQANAVWPDAGRWWAGEAVQAARRLFLDAQCRTAPDAAEQWRKFFGQWS